MPESPTCVLVTDFDGTITKNDFYELVKSRLVPAGTPDYWAQYRSGQITHFEALRAYFAAIRADEAAVMRLVDDMQIDSQLADAVALLERSGWRVVVASAGCRWYIERLLAEARVQIEVHANPGHFVAGKGLLMELPKDSPFFSPTHGIDKAGIVKHYLAAGATVAFAGDGYPDEPAARLVAAKLRFARGDLAEVLAAAREGFNPFSSWSEVATTLTSQVTP